LDWHKRYLQQAAWTRQLRTFLLQLVGVERARWILEVGCGTGAILEELERSWLAPAGSECSLHGLDLEPNSLSRARQHSPAALLTCGDALDLPFPDKSFDITLCHFLLLWVGEPGRAVREMKRITRAQGHVLALAEPDYGARLDRPDDLAILGKWQAASLRRQGADVTIGRRLAEVFDQSGLRILEAGVIKSWPDNTLTADEFATEWEVLREDLAGLEPEAELDRLMELDRQARQNQTRVLRVPTYFACGQV
jgi:SAM-dependent methyltransferase